MEGVTIILTLLAWTVGGACVLAAVAVGTLSVLLALTGEQDDESEDEYWCHECEQMAQALRPGDIVRDKPAPAAPERSPA